MVLPLYIKRYYRPPERYYSCEAGLGGYVGAGGVSFSPIPIHSTVSSSSCASDELIAGGYRWAASSDSFFTFSSGGINPHPFL